VSPRFVRGIHPDSCRSCLAWGYGFNYGLCRPCEEFSRAWSGGECGACHRSLPVKKGYCRLCWCQARLDRCEEMGGATSTYLPLLPHVRRVRHQQLYPKPAVPLRGVGVGSPGVRRKQPPAVAGRPRVAWVQLLLFDSVARVYRYGRVDLRTHPQLDNPWLAWGLHLAYIYGQARGFDEVVQGALNRTLLVLLADHQAGEMIRYSDFQRVLRTHGNSPEHTAHVLAQMGVLIDDRHPAFDTWLEGKLTGLAPGIATQTHRWARVLHDGGPRTKPRKEVTVRNYVWVLRPILMDWSTRYEHLREITREDVLTQLSALQGHQRSATAQALRSLFRWAKNNGVIFRDPTSRIRLVRVAQPIPQPLTATQIAPTLQAADKPHAKVAVALAAVHAARHGEIINMRLSDVDLGNRRLSIAGRTRPLDELTHRVLTDWLDYRRRRWPNTANPHLLISKDSALRLGPVTYPWLNRILRGLPAGLERLRMDRQLDEALTSGADPLQIAEVFGVAESTALRYADAASQLLRSGAEQPPDNNAVATGYHQLD
jgi:integrase